MFDFAKYVLGPVYVVVFLTCILLTAFFIGPIFEYSEPIGIVLELVAIVASMYLASGAKFLAIEIQERIAEHFKK